MANPLDLTDQQFGKLTARWPVGYDKNGKVKWLASCDCGQLFIVRSSSLVSGNTTSCRGGVVSSGNYLTYKREFKSWCMMKQRCLNPKRPGYKNWGGRGIKVCDRWLDQEYGFENFLADMGQRPEGKSLDRYPDNDGNYEPNNCRWATQKEQVSNRRNSKVVLPQAA